MQLSSFLKQELQEIRSADLYRELKTYSAKGLQNYSSNSYLGSSFGAGASRLVTGNNQEYEKLEKAIARWKKTAGALVFPTGYMANLGTISALMGKGDVIIIDKLCHASIIDGCRLSGADLRIYKHCNLDSLEKILKSIQNNYQKKLIISESVFSMDGDTAPLFEITQLAKKYNCWTMVDEAHAVGVFGNTGAGLLEELGLESEFDIVIGTLSKAVDSLGGYVAGSRSLIEYLINSSRSFIYTTALPKSVLGNSIKNIQKIIKNKLGRKKLWQNIGYFYTLAQKNKLKLTMPQSAIIPIIIGEEKKAVAVSKALLKKRIILPAIRYPTVPKGQARLRCTITASQTKLDLENLIKTLADML